MKGISPEVERLMWLIAERRDSRAISDFENRFPDLRFELAKRITMVNDLKVAGRKVPARDIPRFVPRHAAPRATFGRATYVAFALVLGAIAFGSYTIATRTAAQPGKSMPVVRIEPPITPPTNFNQDPRNLKEVNPNDPGQVPPLRTDPHLPPNDPLRKMVTIKFDHAPLQAAIAMICGQAGLSYDPAPGMPEGDVEMVYENVAAAEVLADLGAKFGFTAVPQESGRILLIPARDRTLAAAEPNSPSGSTSGE